VCFNESQSSFVNEEFYLKQQADLREFRWACGEILQIGDRELMTGYWVQYAAIRQPSRLPNDAAAHDDVGGGVHRRWARTSACSMPTRMQL
jgi:hypothetical protein